LSMSKVKSESVPESPKLNGLGGLNSGANSSTNTDTESETNTVLPAYIPPYIKPSSVPGSPNSNGNTNDNKTGIPMYFPEQEYEQPDYLRLILTARCYDILKQTPLTYATNISGRTNNHVYLKREDIQDVFSFKIRGAYNR